MLGPQTQTETVDAHGSVRNCVVDATQFRYRRKVARNYFDPSDLALACAAVHSSLLNDTQPWPLQEFWPLQLFLAVEHSDVPLQELTPVQCTLAVSAANDGVANPEVIIIAAAAAKAEPVNLFMVKFDLLY